MEKEKCKECGQDIEFKARVEIKHRLTGNILKVVNAENLRGADLRNSNLRGADLRGSDLRSCDLRGSDLRSCDLRGSDLRYSDLRGADLRDADLEGSKTKMCIVNFTKNEKKQALQFAEGIDRE